MKKLFSLLLCVSLVLCGPVAYASSIDFSGMSQDELHAVIDQARSELMKFEVYMDSDKVVYDENGIKVTLHADQRIEYGDLLFAAITENNSDKKIIVFFDDAYVNGWAVSAGTVSAIEPGKKSKETLPFYAISDAEVQAIEDVKDLEFTVRIVEDSSFDTLFRSDKVHLIF